MFLRNQVLQVLVIVSALALAVSDSVAKKKYEAMRVKKNMYQEKKNIQKEVQRPKKIASLSPRRSPQRRPPRRSPPRRPPRRSRPRPLGVVATRQGNATCQ